ncbi:NB-ARC domain, LRR domain containing protein [Trema orientale]|uniref:NB-ARC domain, LRR domain containing protein n=1 Tax=Trema orientale TaxID=63057 RepID=A0A2P5EMB2_TREOI|nr:NB-ARC domain, LRR domain containing protein [Trema orientale]
MERLTGGEARRSVISVVGAVGIGKTTLAKKVYDGTVLVERRFDCRAWITVSQTYNMKELLKLVAWQICQDEERDVGNVNMMVMEELIISIRKYLQSKKYMLVFDDVCEVEFWQLMKGALPDNDRGSRIIITTRSDMVVASCNESSFGHVHKMEPLSEEMCQGLFCRIAFQYEPQPHCPPPELEQLCHEFVRLCQGLPLSIVRMAELLSKKEKTTSEWKRLLRNFSHEVESNVQLRGTSESLALSYLDLPRQLKLCFLYFSIFPKDALIPNDKLYKLWIAEGFVQEQTGKTLEVVAEEYLYELIHRNLVQACEGFYGLEKFCIVRSSVHEIARKKADEISFCRILDGKNSGFSEKSRRLSVYSLDAANVLETNEDSQVRAVFLSNIGALDKSFMVTLFEKYKLLVMLDFENVPLEHLPKELGNLFLLKYLSLKNTKVKGLPKSVGELINLRTLDLRNTQLIQLPSEIKKLQNLRHLLASVYDNKITMDSTQGVRINEGIGFLENLRTLMTVDADHSGIGLIEELEKLRQLRRLDISGLTAEISSALSAYIEEMSHLECLIYFIATTSFATAPFEGTLTEVTRLEGSLPKLKLLVLRELSGLKVVEIEDGALPRLEELRIGSSPLLNEVPSGVQHLRNLKVLSNYDMPKEFVLSMQPDGGSFDDEEHSASEMNHVNRLSFASDEVSFFSDDIED